MLETKTKLGAGGRLVIPSEYRKKLGLAIGDDVLMVLGDGELKIMTPKQAVKNAQALVARYVPAKRDLVGELLKERRREAERE